MLSLEKLNEDENLMIEVLHDVIDKVCYKVIVSIIEKPKTVIQICYENNLPLSSTYKKIRKLEKYGLIYIDKIDIDDRGKRVIHYKSRIKSLEFNLKKDGLLLHFDKNEFAKPPDSNIIFV